MQRALRKLTDRLEEAQIPCAIIGAMPLNADEERSLYLPGSQNAARGVHRQSSRHDEIVVAIAQQDPSQKRIPLRPASRSRRDEGQSSPEKSAVRFLSPSSSCRESWDGTAGESGVFTMRSASGGGASQRLPDSRSSPPTDEIALGDPRSGGPTLLSFALSMNERRGWGSTVLGWFVVQEPSAEEAASREYSPRAPVDYSPRAAADSSARLEPIAGTRATPPPAAPGGRVDFGQLFQAAGIDPEESARVVKTLELLDSLPTGTEEATRKQIVMASLRAFGVPIDQIIETGAQEIEALEMYIRSGAGDTEKVIAEAEARIRQYEEEIANLRRVMEERVDEQKGVIHACNSKKLEIQRVLEFFGQEAVAKVVRKSPKLHEPAV